MLVCRFVDSISATATVRLDMNLAPWTTLVSTDFGFPPMEYAITSTLLPGGDFVSAADDSNRVLALRLQIKTATVDEAATQVQRLIRELDRDENWLETRMGATPVFFKTFRARPNGWEIHTDGKFLNIDVDVIAEPHAYGLLETPISAQTLNTDPAAGSNGCFIDATGIKGDVDTPMYVRWPASAIVAGRVTLFAVRKHGTPSGAPFVFQLESQTNGTDTADTVDAGFSNGNGIRTTFATNQNMVTRSTISDLGTAGVDLRGQYRVFVRYAKTVSGDGIGMRLQWGTSGGTVTSNATKVLPSGTTDQMVDLGLIQIPRGQDPVHDPLTGAEVAVSDTYHMAVQAEQTSGSGDLDIDYVVLVPADEGTATMEWVEAGPSYWWLDGSDQANSHARNASDQVATAMAPNATAPVPWLAPNQTNRIYMLQEVGSGMATTLTTVTVTVSYHPRYVPAMRPVST